MTRPVEVRARLVDILRRDLVGPGPQDEDLARERLSENPSRWYLTGFTAPKEDEADDPAVQEEDEREAEQDLGSGAGSAAGDDEPGEAPVTHRRFLPSSIGLTVLLPMDVEAIEARVSWGDYVTEPPLPEGALLREENEDGASRRHVDWVRVPQQRSVPLPIANGRGGKLVPDSSSAQMSGGGVLELTSHAREFAYGLPDESNERVRAVTVFLWSTGAQLRGGGMSMWPTPFKRGSNSSAPMVSARVTTCPAMAPTTKICALLTCITGTLRNTPSAAMPRHPGRRMRTVACVALGPTICRSPKWKGSRRMKTSRMSSSGWRRWLR